MARTVETALPSAYADEKLPEMRRRWDNALGQTVRRYGARLWPGVPFPALVGLSANSTSSQETTDVGEVGYYQTFPGPYRAIAASAEVFALLGRHPDFANWRTDIEGQTVVGIIDYRNQADAFAAAFPEARAPRGTQWDWAGGEMGYNVGGTSAGRMVRAQAPWVAQLPVEQRYSGWIVSVGRAPVHSNAYPALRCWQRLATSQALARDIGEDGPWYNLAFDDATGARLQRALSEGTILGHGTPVNVGASELATKGPGLLVRTTGELVVGAVVVGGLLYAGVRYWRRHHGAARPVQGRGR